MALNCSVLLGLASRQRVVELDGRAADAARRGRGPARARLLGGQDRDGPHPRARDVLREPALARPRDGRHLLPGPRLARATAVCAGRQRGTMACISSNYMCMKRMKRLKRVCVCVYEREREKKKERIEKMRNADEIPILRGSSSSCGKRLEGTRAIDAAASPSSRPTSRPSCSSRALRSWIPFGTRSSEKRTRGKTHGSRSYWMMSSAVTIRPLSPSPAIPGPRTPSFAVSTFERAGQGFLLCDG